MLGWESIVFEANIQVVEKSVDVIFELENVGDSEELVDSLDNELLLDAIEVGEDVGDGDSDGEEDDDDDDDDPFDPFEPLLSSRPSTSNTTILAFASLGTVTTQKVAPPAPGVSVPEHWLTECFLGSIAQGRPLQPSPSHSILTPHFGISFLKGVSGSKYTGFQPTLTKV